MATLTQRETELHFRPATQADFPAIAMLLIQLYEAELPGALGGNPAGQQELLEFTLGAKNQQGLRNRYVVCDAQGAVLASAVLETPGQTPYERAPDGTVGRSLKLIGYRATLQLLVVVAKSMIGGKRPDLSDSVFIHSLVVDHSQRGRGIGRFLLEQLEQLAKSQGYLALSLQVLAENTPARQLYTRHGYQDIWQSPGWANRLSWPSFIMQKRLF